jgi:hypothetical protein
MDGRLDVWTDGRWVGGCARRRLVVKRPRGVSTVVRSSSSSSSSMLQLQQQQPPLLQQQQQQQQQRFPPSATFKGKSTDFDVFVLQPPIINDRGSQPE